MQQTRVIRIARILRIQLPVAVHVLTLVAEDFNRAIKYPLNARYHHWAKIFIQRCHGIGESRKNEAVESSISQGSESVCIEVKVRWHSAFAFDPRSKGYTFELTFKIVRPLVIHELQPFRVASTFAANECAAMGASILHHANVAGVVAGYEYRRFAHIGCFIVAVVG
jgi:hypothetical protein